MSVDGFFEKSVKVRLKEQFSTELQCLCALQQDYLPLKFDHFREIVVNLLAINQKTKQALDLR